MKGKLLYIFTAIVLLLYVQSFAAEIKSVGYPYVQNYSKALYQAGNQNWSVTQDENRILYFGNTQGVLSYDGKYWQLHHMPHNIIVRCVAADGKGKIYAGGFGEFGYWQNNSKGILTYHSFTGLLKEKQLLNEEIWKIYVDGNRVLFQSFGAIFIYQDGKIHIVKPQSSYLFLFKASNRFFVGQWGKGLYELRNDHLYPLNAQLLADGDILSVLPFKKGQFLIGTSKKGLFVYDGHEVKKFDTQADSFLQTYQLNNGTVVLGRYYAFGTILNGLIIIDENGRIVQQINKLSGLQNNTSLGLYTDANQNLWVATDNGIDRVEINSPLYFYLDKTGKFGTVYASIVYNNKIYIGTNQGLFYSEWQQQNGGAFKTFDFRIVPGSQGQVWDLSLINGKLICGHNNGTYEVVDTRLRTISKESGGWMIKKLDESHYIQGTYNGLVIYKINGSGGLEFSHKIKNFDQPSSNLSDDGEGYVWVSHAYKGVYRIKLSNDLTRAVEVSYYNNRNNLPDSYHINMFKLNGELVFSSDSGFYTYDRITNKFNKYTVLNHLLGTFASSNKIITAMKNKYWFINHGHVALVDFSVRGKLAIDSSRFTILNGQMVQYYENIHLINNGIYLISVDNGFVIFNDEDAHLKQNVVLPPVLIRKVENITNKIVKITESASCVKHIEIPYKGNNIRIYYSLPYHNLANVKYQYFLEGYSEDWSSWSSATENEFTNLSAGEYHFKVRAKVDGIVTSGISQLTIIVSRPWYTSYFAIIVYLFMLVPLYYLIRMYYRRKLMKHQSMLRKKFLAEKEEAVKREAVLKEQEIYKLKNEQLQRDLENKSRELANSAMNIVYKNELLEKIRSEILDLKDSSGKRLTDDQVRRIEKVIDEGKTDERDWNIFEDSFNEAHENFFKKLKHQHPDLVPNDLKLCAFLRMNMSSKEIASLLNITLRGVEIRRYRLRKKLQLAHDKNLTEFLLEL